MNLFICTCLTCCLAYPSWLWLCDSSEWLESSHDFHLRKLTQVTLINDNVNTQIELILTSFSWCWMSFSWKKFALLSRKLIRNSYGVVLIFININSLVSAYKHQPAFHKFLMINACQCLQRTWHKRRCCNNLQQFDQKIDFIWNYVS